MAADWQRNLKCPGLVTEVLQRFINEINPALGEELLSLILYGDLVKGEYIPNKSSVNVMLVLRTISIELLERARSPIQLARRDLRLTTMVLSEQDLTRSTDVFPIKFLDIKNQHRLLFGRDLMSDLKIAPDHLRLRCEQEIKNLMLRLRQFYLQRAHFAESIEGILVDSLAPFIIDLEVLLQLKTGQQFDNQTELINQACKVLGFDKQTLTQLDQIKRGELSLDADEIKRLYNAYMVLVEQAAQIADQL